ncbi:MAG: AAA family ATPase [Candidatus Coatesbacteria bacterium]|nr:AAA family ATPase [Candidatus Coatesbacteria bacterium]
MIKKFGVKNFKAFKDTGDIELKPMTVIAGPNNCGKTTILQSLLLLKQTIETQDPRIPLSIHGRFTDFTSLGEIAFGRPGIGESHIEYRISVQKRITIKLIPSYFPDVTVDDDANDQQLWADIKFSFNDGKSPNGKGDIEESSFDMATSVESHHGPRLSLQRLKAGEYTVKISGHGMRIPQFLNEKDSVNFDYRFFLPSYFGPTRDEENGDGLHRAEMRWLDPIFLNPLLELERDLSDRLWYLGPLREPPQRSYPHRAGPFKDLGTAGEKAAQILNLEHDRTIDYLPAIDGQIEQVRLCDAVDDAFRRLGLAENIDVRSLASTVYEVVLPLGPDKKKWITISDVGFGISQLFPIIVMSFVSPDDSILIFEQPEIHLHPKLQAGLADFLLTVALAGKRVLLETHSDHFINRLRRRIAEDPSDELKDKVNILFISPPQDGEGARIDQLKVDRYGIIENWPPDFLPEASDEAERIIRAGFTKRNGK